MPQVKPERTGWRDQRLSEEHRRWGWNCPALDIDFLFLEYDRGRVVALVEYKHESAPKQYASHPSYQALIDLGNRAGIPVFVCRYADDFSSFTVTPLNAVAIRLCGRDRLVFTKREWVKFLHHLRGYEAPETLLDEIETEV